MGTTIRHWILIILAAGGNSQWCALEPSRCAAEESGEAGKMHATTPETALSGRAQGTTYHIRYWKTHAHLADAEVQSAVDALLAQIDAEMSTYRDDSELSRFNRAAPNEWFAVSRETARVVAAALKYNRLTGGAQDVTVLPLLRLWHFGPDGKSTDNGEFEAPTAEELGRTRALVGAERVHVCAEPPALRKDLTGVEVDLSSIAPGYAVDAIGEAFTTRGIANYMVELGGEVRAAGLRPDGQPWRIGIESPWPVEKPLAHTLPLRDLSLSTSGDYRKVRRVGDQRLTHIIDPHTGRPLPFRGVAVTVVAPTCIEADGLSTGVFVMGPTAGYDWCVKHDVAGLFQSRGASRGEVIEQATPRYLAIASTNSATRDE